MFFCCHTLNTPSISPLIHRLSSCRCSLLNCNFNNKPQTWLSGRRGDEDGKWGRGIGSRVARFAYFIEATHKWHLSKHIFHTYPTNTHTQRDTHTCVGSLFSLLALPEGKKAYFKCGTSCAPNRDRGCSACLCVCVCVCDRVRHTKAGSEWGKGAEQKKCSSRKPLSCFATFKHVKFLRSTCRWQADGGATTVTISHSCSSCVPPTALVVAIFILLPLVV